jgi:pyridinium-3,5-biscarboxylic acid mononucleotide sulfurtransferase
LSAHVPHPQVAARLVETIVGYGSTLVAFSGGVDSGLVLAAAARALGPDRVAAVTAVSPSLPATELQAARDFVTALGIRHLTPETDEWRRAEYQANDARRCYFCKSALMAAAEPLRAELGFATICTGTNASDSVEGFRPGIAAAAERGARTPLRDLGVTKTEVRAVARLWGLTLADKPAMACLASRIAYGVPVQPWRLARVERAEAALRSLLGDRLRDLRVRDLGDRVRVEVDAGLVASVAGLAAMREALAAAGFDVPVQVEPFRSGSLNDALR